MRWLWQEVRQDQVDKFRLSICKSIISEVYHIGWQTGDHRNHCDSLS